MEHPKTREDIVCEALERAAQVLGADSAYFGKEGEQEVDNQLRLMGYEPEDYKVKKEVRTMEHPQISRTLATGYPEREETVVADYPIEDIYGYEIKEGDHFFTDQQGQHVLETNLEDYLIEKAGFTFHTAGRD